jgi:AraC-like DNA-binding protein/uncharacterized cupin superfamily protein
MVPRDYRIEDAGAGITAIRKTHAATNPERHFHESYEILYLISGERTFFLGSRTFYIRGGDFLCIKPGLLHRALNRLGESCDLINIYFGDQRSPYLAALLPLLEACLTRERPVISIPETERYGLTAAFQAVATELSEKRLGYVQLAWGLLYQSLAEIARLAPGAPEGQSPSPMSETAARLLDYVSRNFRESLSLGQLAREFGLSESHVSRLFPQTTRFTFTEYLSGMRVQEACRLLTETELPVSRISEACGFGSLTQFGRCFRRTTGLSPLSWRKRSGRAP